MRLYIEVISGPAKGKTYKVGKGMRLGRSVGEIIIKDPKISTHHAQIELDSKGNFVLVDNDSSNGLLLRGRRVKKLVLIPGVAFQAGNTEFKVIRNDEGALDDLVFESAGSPKRNWQEALNQVLVEDNDFISNDTKQSSVMAFEKPLLLSFVQGPQFDEQWHVGWGPRLFGRQTLEYILIDPSAPEEAFSLEPDGPHAVFKTREPSLVLINNKSVSTKTLKPGDEISFGETRIRVEFLRYD